MPATSTQRHDAKSYEEFLLLKKHIAGMCAKVGDVRSRNKDIPRGPGVRQPQRLQPLLELRNKGRECGIPEEVVAFGGISRHVEQTPVQPASNVRLRAMCLHQYQCASISC